MRLSLTWVLNTWWSLFAYSLLAFSLQRAISHMAAKKKKKNWFGIPKLRNSKASFQWQKVKVKVAQSCPTLCDFIDLIVHGIAQARILEWVAFPFSRDLPNPGIEPRFPILQADSLPTELSGKPSDRGTHMIETVLRELQNPTTIQTLYSSYKAGYSAKV